MTCALEITSSACPRPVLNGDLSTVFAFGIHSERYSHAHWQLYSLCSIEDNLLLWGSNLSLRDCDIMDARIFCLHLIRVLEAKLWNWPVWTEHTWLLFGSDSVSIIYLHKNSLAIHLNHGSCMHEYPNFMKCQAYRRILFLVLLFVYVLVFYLCFIYFWIAGYWLLLQEGCCCTTACRESPKRGHCGGSEGSILIHERRDRLLFHYFFLFVFFGQTPMWNLHQCGNPIHCWFSAICIFETGLQHWSSWGTIHSCCRINLTLMLGNFHWHFLRGPTKLYRWNKFYLVTRWFFVEMIFLDVIFSIYFSHSPTIRCSAIAYDGWDSLQ